MIKGRTEADCIISGQKKRHAFHEVKLLNCFLKFRNDWLNIPPNSCVIILLAISSLYIIFF